MSGPYLPEPPQAEAYRQQLPDLGDGLQAQCHDLWRAPSAERCERLAFNLVEAQRLALSLRDRLMAEGEGR